MFNKVEEKALTPSSGGFSVLGNDVSIIYENDS